MTFESQSLQLKITLDAISFSSLVVQEAVQRGYSNSWPPIPKRGLDTSRISFLHTLANNFELGIQNDKQTNTLDQDPILGKMNFCGS